jgi:hypothetical protein
MASWAAIEMVGVTVRTLIQARLDDVMPGTKAQLVTPASFERLTTTSEAVVSVFLYRIEENRETRNHLRMRDAAGNELPPRRNLDLWYLVTPWTARPDNPDGTTDETAAREEHRLLGVVIQALASAAELTAAQLEEDPVAPVFAADDGLQIILESLPTEEHYRIWDASKLPYRLSLTYRARLVGIDALEVPVAPRVVGGTFRLGEGP